MRPLQLVVRVSGLSGMSGMSGQISAPAQRCFRLEGVTVGTRRSTHSATPAVLDWEESHDAAESVESAEPVTWVGDQRWSLGWEVGAWSETYDSHIFFTLAMRNAPTRKTTFNTNEKCKAERGTG